MHAHLLKVDNHSKHNSEINNTHLLPLPSPIGLHRISTELNIV